MGDKKGQRSLERAKMSPHGWRRTELDELYKSYGFVIDAGAKHDIVKHPDYPILRATLTRSSGALHPDYIRHAVDMIKKLLKRQQEKLEEAKNE